MKQKEFWIDIRLSEEEINFLRDAISDPENEGENCNHVLVGNISKSERIKDKDNWFYETVLKKLTEKLFYRDWDVYHKYHVEKEEPLPKFGMNAFWVNYMKQHEFNPLPHIHRALYSFVVFMKIPTHWKDQHALPFVAHSSNPCASDFQFAWSRKDRDELIFRNFPLSSEDEGRMLFFPATLQHQVFPFYGTEEERVTISGNIILKEPNKPEIPVGEYEEKENMLKIMENSVRVTREELKMMKKEKADVEQ